MEKRLKQTRTRKRARRFFAWLWLCASLALFAPVPADALADADLRVALPASGELRVENQRGGVSVEVWNENYVSVSAVVEETATPPPRRTAKGRAAARQPTSPVRIENSEKLLSVSVTRSVASRVDLEVRIPREARAQIFTGDGRIEVRGLPAQLSAQSVSGDINLDIAAPADADLSAHSLNGTVTFKNGAGATARPETFVRQKFQTRLGSGRSVVRLFSGRGGIQIGTAETSPDVARDAGRGTPATVVSQPRASQMTGGRASELVPDARQTSPSSSPSLAGSSAIERKAPVLVGAGRGETAAPAKVETPEGPEEVDEDEVVRVETELVRLNVSVIDRASGRGLVNLAQKDFRLSEDGVEQEIAHFEAASAPFDLVLLIDLSGSTGRVTNVIRAAALSFVNAARAQDRIGIITFASETRIVSPLTTNREALRAGIGAMELPVGDTKLYDAVDFALEQFAKDANNTRRRAVVLMSDGLDSTLPNVTGVGSAVSYEDLRARVREFDGVLYALWTSTEYEAFSPLDIQPETFDLVHQRMQELAEAGGGVFYEVEKLEDLAGTYERVVADLGTVYSLSYRPTNKTRDGRWRAIRVTLPQHPNAVARGKRGYNAK
ncbi:MAG TPA: VWA domain-containing protein [Pyrinomonadaceae bacterium]|jgi:VWFA-related protein|nr:VWA domain-containing protein [Pyrinomonadaceae bacterium]